MAAPPVPPLTPTAVQVEERFVLTVTALCRATGADADQVGAWVAEGVLHPIGGPAGAWVFSVQALPRTRTALRLARDFELDSPGVALVMELLDEIAYLRARQRQP